MKQHLSRQAGVQSVEVNLIDGKVDITPKEDGRIDPTQLLKATYDSGVTTAELDVIVRGKIVKTPSGELGLQVHPNQTFSLASNEISRTLEPLANTPTEVTIRGQLYKKPPGKKKPELPSTFTLTVLEVQRKE